MGILKTITEEYFGETEREEDKIDIKGIERKRFTDNNGNEHIGYYIPNRSIFLLRELIHELIKRRGNKCDLNDIDVSNIDDMTELFGIDYDYPSNFSTPPNSSFNGDISGWNVSNVENMERMFLNSRFNGNLSKWNVQHVKDMYQMFMGSEFSGTNGDISGWNVQTDTDVQFMFCDSSYEGKHKDYPKWWYNAKNEDEDK